MIKLILADMDGTLLPFGSRVVSERTHSAILSALDAGIAFGPASGRDYADLADAFDDDARCTFLAHCRSRYPGGTVFDLVAHPVQEEGTEPARP